MPEVARHTVSYLAGVRIWIRGSLLFLKRPRFWLYLVIPLMLNLALTVLIFTAGWDYLGHWLPEWHYPGVDAEGSFLVQLLAHGRAVAIWVGTGLGWAFSLLVLLVLWVITFVFMAGILGSPFYDKLSLAVERSEGLAIPDRPFSMRQDLILPLGYTVKMSVLQVAVMIFLLPLNWIPLLGQAGYAVLWSIVLTCGLTAYCFERREIRVRDQLRFAWRHRRPYIGFGVTAMITMLPFGLVILTLPLSVCGASLLFTVLWREEGHASESGWIQRTRVPRDCP